MVSLELRPGSTINRSADLGRKDRAAVIRRLQHSGLFREYQRAFEATTGLPLVLREAGSFRAPLEGSGRVNSFCGLMTQANATCAACLQFQQRVEVASMRGSRTVECHAGLVETAVPVRAGDHVLGYLQTGQVFPRRPTRAGFRAAMRFLTGRMKGTAPAVWEAAYFKTRVIPPRQYRMIIRLLGVFAEHLGTISNRLMIGQTQTDSPFIKRLRDYIGAHYTEPICLRETARTMHVSPFHLCKVFRGVIGLTFTGYVARVRTEAVKVMLLNDDVRISEAAYAVGFQSLSQFNRVFQRITGEAPRHYRDRLHGRNGKGEQPVPRPVVSGREPAAGVTMPSRPRAALAVELYG